MGMLHFQALSISNDKIVTCDRDEKIRISNFPSAYEVDSYLLGHKEAVVNISLVAYDYYLVSASVVCLYTWFDFLF